MIVLILVQHLIPNIVGYYICVRLHTLLHCVLLGIVAQSLKMSNVELRTNGRNDSQHCWINTVVSCCICLNVALRFCVICSPFLEYFSEAKA